MEQPTETSEHKSAEQAWTVVQLAATTQCIHCAQALSVNACEDQITCNKCQQITKIPWKKWVDIFKDIKDDIKQGRLQEPRNIQLFEANSAPMSFNFRRHAIVCSVCENQVAFKADFSADEGKLVCESCQSPIPYRRVLKNLKSEVGSLQWMAGEEFSASKSPIDLSAQNIVQKCPSCGGSLPIDGKNRVVTCTFCASNVTLSETIWHRLHPSKAHKNWYLIFSGGLGSKGERHQAYEKAKAKRANRPNKSVFRAEEDRTTRPAPLKARSPYQVWVDQGGSLFYIMWGICFVGMLIMYNQDSTDLNLLLSGQQSFWEQMIVHLKLLLRGPLSDIDYHPIYLLMFYGVSGIAAILYYFYIKNKLAKGWIPPLPDDSDD